MYFGNAVAEALETMRTEKKVYKDYLPKEAIQAGIKTVEKTGNL